VRFSVAPATLNRTGGMQGLFPRSDPCETGHGSRTGCSTCWLLSAPVGTLCRLLWRECTPFSRKPGEPLANLPACVTRETRVIGTMPEAAAVTPVTIIRVSCHNVLATQRLQQRFRVCRVMPISQASCRNPLLHSEIYYLVKICRLVKCHTLTSFLSMR
jgi:hypothetical protein